MADAPRPPAAAPAPPGPSNERHNATYFDAWTNYQELVHTLDTYASTTRALAGELRGRVVDVGSGGVVNYDCAPITELTLVDISTEYLRHATVPPTALVRTGSAVALPLEDGAYDGVLMQMLVHHLAERDFATTRDRSETAFREAFRVLRPGGRLVVLESVVHPGFELAEHLLFPMTRLALRLLGHPLVLQWSAARLEAFARAAGFDPVQRSRVPRGRWQIFLGRRWPTALVPVSVCKLVAVKPA